MREGATMDIATTAAEAYERYSALLAGGNLVQGTFHSENNGRQLACALGALGPDLDSASKCPAAVMPRWLAQMVPFFFDRQKANDAYAWGLDFYAELKRLDGKVPFSVIHDWHARYTTALAIDVATKMGKPTAPHETLRALHAKALSGDNPSYDEWRDGLRPALGDAYTNAYAYAVADAYAHADAYAYAYAYADAYADANADAYTYADANAYAHADAYAYAVKRLADGMIDCLRRVEVAS